MTAESPIIPDGGPPMGEQPGSGQPRSTRTGFRFPAKVARRELRRRPWRAVLVVLLVALPTWVMFNAAIQMRTSLAASESAVEDFSSDLVVPFADPGRTDPQLAARANRAVAFGYTGTGSTSADIEQALPDGSTTQRVIGGYTSIMTGDGSIRGATFMKIDLSTDAASTWAVLTKGRAPEAGEVVLGVDLARDLGLDVGDTLTLQQPAGEWLVVGIASTTSGDLVAIRDFDESLLTITSGVLLVDLPTDIGAAAADQLQSQLGAYAPEHSRFAVDESYGTDTASAVVGVWLLAIILFLMFGVIIVAAFATIARGQLVTVGQLAANGATQAFTRRVMALQGFWTGVAGAALGGLATLAALPWTKRIITGGFSAPVRLTWNPLDVLAIGLIGVGIATAAAALPALALVKTSVLDALAGRRPEQPVPKAMVPVGVISFGVGLLLLVVSSTSESGVRGAGATLGSLAMVVGVCLVGPLVVQLASRAASAMPLAARISLRGLGRARLRSAAVVSSIAITTGVMAVIVAGVQTDVGGPKPGDYRDNVALVMTYPSVQLRSPAGEPLLDADGVPLPGVAPATDTVDLEWFAASDDPAVENARTVLPTATQQPLRVAVRPDGRYDNRDGQFIREPTPEELQEFSPGWGQSPPGVTAATEFESLPLIADDAILAAFSLPDSFGAGLATAGYAYAVTGSDCGPEGNIDDTWGGQAVEAPADAASRPESVTVALIPVEGLDCFRWYGPFMTEQFALDHGYQIEPAGSLIVNPAPLTRQQRSQLIGPNTNPSMFVGWDFAGAADQMQTPGVDSSVVAASWQTASSGVSVYWPTYSDEMFAVVQLTVFGVAAFFVTIIAGIGLALAASDSRRDRAVLSVIGARPATQRRVAATDAWVLVVIGTLLGVPAALFAARVVTVANHQDTPTGIPWLFVAAELIVIPLFVAGCAYLAGLLQRARRPMSVLAVD